MREGIVGDEVRTVLGSRLYGTLQDTGLQLMILRLGSHYGLKL
jgi:hypothetical protein